MGYYLFHCIFAKNVSFCCAGEKSSGEIGDEQQQPLLLNGVHDSEDYSVAAAILP